MPSEVALVPRGTGGRKKGQRMSLDQSFLSGKMQTKTADGECYALHK